MYYKVGSGWLFEGCLTEDNHLGFAEKYKSRFNTNEELVVELECAVDIGYKFLPLYTETAYNGTTLIKNLNPQMSDEERIETFVKSNKRCFSIPTALSQFVVVTAHLVFDKQHELKESSSHIDLYALRNIGRNFEQYDKSITTSATPFFMCDKFMSEDTKKDLVGSNEMFGVSAQLLNTSTAIILQKLTYDNVKTKTDYYLMRVKETEV